MSIGILFLLFVAASGWWLYSRLAAHRDAQERRRAAEMLYVFETRSQARNAPHVTPAAASGFGPTLPEGIEGHQASH